MSDNDDLDEKAHNRQELMDLLDTPRISRRQKRGAEDPEYLTPSEQEPGPVDEFGAVYEQDELDATNEFLSVQKIGDQLAAKAGLRRQQWSKLNNIAPFSRNNPPSVLNGTLGGQQPVTFGQKRQVVNWAGVDAETLPISITLAPQEQLEVGGAFEPMVGYDVFINPTGIIQFGTRGALVKAYVDIGTGVQLTISGSQVTVEVELPNIALGVPPNLVGYTILLSGMISFQNITRTAPLTRTLAVIAAATGTYFTIPPFAKNVLFYRVPDTQAFRLGIFSKYNQQLYQHTQAASTNMTPLELSGDAVYVVVSDPAAGSAIRGRLIFELTI